MANIPIRDIPGAVVASPDPSNLIPMDNGSLMQKTTIANAVNTALPLASQATAEAGLNNSDRMSSLRTKQAIDAQVPTIVGAAITTLNLGTMSQEDASDYTPTSGLAAVALSNDYNDLDSLPTLGTMSQETAADYTKTSGLAAVALSNSYTDLSDLPTLGTAAATDASDYATAAQGALADTAVQPGNAALVPSGGTTGQVLVKDSDTDYDTGWVSSAAATAVSYAPQVLTEPQKAQARQNIGALPTTGGTMTGLLTLAPADDDPDGTASLNIPAGADVPDVQVDGDLWADSNEDLRYRRGGEDATVYDSVSLPRPEPGEMAAGTETAPRALSAADVRAGVALSKMWESAPQTITAAGLLTLAHDLGVMPKLLKLALVNMTAEYGYAAGDEVSVDPTQFAGPSAQRGATLRADASSVLVRYGSAGTFIVFDNTGLGQETTAANWRVIVRAFA